jgi:YgiT-type zinc finger domain-containing protein
MRAESTKVENPNGEGPEHMKCENNGCGGEYTRTTVSRAFEYQGSTVVVDGIPAQICDLCGETVFEAGMLDRVREVLKRARPAHTAPVYAYESELAAR